MRYANHRFQAGLSLMHIMKFDLSSITSRRTVMDAGKLEYLNKHHLMRELTTDDGLSKMAERAHDTVKTAFPARSDDVRMMLALSLIC